MSRQRRAAETSKPWAFRITDAERLAWAQAARAEGCSTLSAWAVKTLNTRAAQVASKALKARTAREQAKAIAATPPASAETSVIVPDRVRGQGTRKARQLT